MKNENNMNQAEIINTFITPVVRTKSFESIETLKEHLCKQVADVSKSLSSRWIIKAINMVILPEISYVELEMKAKKK